MPDQDPPVDEFGIPIKKKVSSQSEIDEYGIPVKKKEKSSWAGGGLLSNNGGTVGTSESQSVDTELPSTGQSALSGITSKIGTLKTAAKPKKIQPENVITDYNKSFRDITGTKSSEFTLGSDLPQIKKAREQKEYVSNRNIFENEIKPVQSGVATGTVSPQELKALYEKPYGKKVVADIVRSELPELEINDLEPNAMRPNEDKFGEIAQQLQAKNRQQGVDAQNQSEFNLDNELSTTLSGSTYGADRIGVRGGGESFTERKQDNFGDINTSRASELSDALRKINSSTKVWDADGKEVDKKELSEKIKTRIFQLKAGEEIHPEIAQEEEMIARVVDAMPVEYKRQGGSANNERDAEYVMSGLNFIKDTRPGEYNTIMSTMKVTGKMPETTYTELANIGKDVRFYKDFKSGEYVEQDDRSFLTPQLKKANLAGWLSEDLARKGFRNRSAFTQKEILESYQNAPEELKDDELVADIIKAERAPSFGFIPIPQGEGVAKKGVLNSAMRGMATPIGDILNSVDVGFTSSYKSPFDAYLKSKELDRGNQTIINKKGDFTKTLDDNFWNKGVEGFFNLITQAAIARGIGNVAKMPLNAAIGRVDPRAVITSNQAALSMGTPLSTMGQTFGSEYMDFLEKTGSPTKATLGALASGLVQGQIERFVMPDVKLVDDLNLLTARKNFAKEIINVVDNGGGRKGVADVVKDYVGNVTKIIGKEAWLEEGAQNAFGNYLTEKLISPNTAQDRDLLKETIDTGLAATAQMSLFSLFGAAGQTKSQIRLGKAGLNSIAANSEQFIDALGNQLAKGEISQPDYDLATQIINKHRENNLNAPKRDANGELISAERQLEYAYQSTVADIAEQQANKISDKIQKEPFEKKIAEADKIRRQIFYGEENKDLPSKEGEPIAIAPELIQNESLLDEIKANADVTEIEQGFDLQYFIDKAGEDPVSIERRFGKDVLKKLLEKVPTEKLIENYIFAAKIDETSPIAVKLDEVIAEREAQQEDAAAEPVVSGGDGTYEYEGKKYKQEGNTLTNEDGSLVPLDMLEELVQKGKFTPTTNEDVSSGEGVDAATKEYEAKVKEVEQNNADIEKRKQKVVDDYEAEVKKLKSESGGKDVTLDEVLVVGNKFTAPNGTQYEIRDAGNGRVQVLADGDSFAVIGRKSNGEIMGNVEGLQFLRYAAGKVDAKEVDNSQKIKDLEKQRDTKLAELDKQKKEIPKQSPQPQSSKVTEVEGENKTNENEQPNQQKSDKEDKQSNQSELEAQRDIDIVKLKIPEMGDVNEAIPSREEVAAKSETSDKLAANKKTRQDLKNRYTEIKNLFGCLIKL